jgi:hypothetical protein
MGLKCTSMKAVFVGSASQPLGHCSLSAHPHAVATLRIPPNAGKNKSTFHFFLVPGMACEESTIITRACQNRLKKSLPLSHQPLFHTGLCQPPILRDIPVLFPNLPVSLSSSSVGSGTIYGRNWDRTYLGLHTLVSVSKKLKL